LSPLSHLRTFSHVFKLCLPIYVPCLMYLFLGYCPLSPVLCLCSLYIPSSIPCLTALLLVSRPLYPVLKGHDNEADFLGFLQKLVPHRSLTLPFKPFWFWLRIRGDIRNRRRLPDLASWRVGESAFECLKENSESWRVGDSASRGAAME
jgi:hypothetical protein